MLFRIEFRKDFQKAYNELELSFVQFYYISGGFSLFFPLKLQMIQFRTCNMRISGA